MKYKNKRRDNELINNKGFTLIEMIIVLAIIGLLSTMAYATVTIINTAKAKEAAGLIEDEIAETNKKNMSQMCQIYESDGTLAGGISDKAEFANYRFAMRIHYDSTTNKIYLKKGYYNVKDSTYIFLDHENTNSGKGKSFSNRINVVYTDTLGNKTNLKTGSVKELNIVFDKKGRVLVGEGEYDIYKNSDIQVANILINQNGSRIIK